MACCPATSNNLSLCIHLQLVAPEMFSSPPSIAPDYDTPATMVHNKAHWPLTCLCHCFSCFQPCLVAAVPHKLPQPPLLSRLLNATQQDLPSMLRQIVDPLTAPFATLSPLSELPIDPDGSHSRWRYNGQALLEHHMQQIRKLPVSDALPTAGLLGQPLPGSDCPAAPSLTRSKVGCFKLPVLLMSARSAVA